MSPASNRKRRVLVTGATGFLGQHVLLALQRRPDVEVIAACRSPGKLPPDFSGEVRRGDLRDGAYRAAMVRDVDVICHAGTWGAFWGHADEERREFLEPTVDLIQCAIEAGVTRFLLASSVVIAAVPKPGGSVDDFAPTERSGYWPHLDYLIELDTLMKQRSVEGTQMVNMRLGHFVGAGNVRGIVPALIPRLRTGMVPWLRGGKARLALVAGEDMGEAFALAATAPQLQAYESFNICGSEFPTARETISFIAERARTPKPWFSVPFALGYAFGWIMEKLGRLMPSGSPFLTRSIVRVSEDWFCPTGYAEAKLGYRPQRNWRDAVSESIEELRASGFPWPSLAQATSAGKEPA